MPGRAVATRRPTPSCDANPALPPFRYLLDRVGGGLWPFARREILGGIGAVRYRVLHGAGVWVHRRYFVQPDLDAGAFVRLLPEVEPLSDTFRLAWSRAGR